MRRHRARRLLVRDRRCGHAWRRLRIVVVVVGMKEVVVMRWPSYWGEGLVLELRRISRQAKTGNGEGWRRVHVGPNDVREVE